MRAAEFLDPLTAFHKRIPYRHVNGFSFRYIDFNMSTASEEKKHIDHVSVFELDVSVFVLDVCVF
jgi:hypothetical protein